MLPLILAGPILRRTEPTLVSVWIALSEAARVEVRIWEGLVHDTSDSGTFATDLPSIQPTSNSASTIRIGDQLHLAVVTFTLPPERALLPNLTYSYNVVLSKESGGSHDLKSEQLLKDGQISGHPHLAMGYEPGFLPTFQLPPVELTDLRIVHASCRRIT